MTDDPEKFRSEMEKQAKIRVAAAYDQEWGDMFQVTREDTVYTGFYKSPNEWGAVELTYDLAKRDDIKIRIKTAPEAIRVSLGTGSAGGDTSAAAIFIELCAQHNPPLQLDDLHDDGIGRNKAQ